MRSTGGGLEAGRTGSILHQQALTVLGLLTGFMITSLVLILGSPGPFRSPIGPLSGEEYFQILSTYVALVCVVSLVGVMAFAEVAGGWMAVGSRVDQFGYSCFLVVVFGFAGELSLLLVPFNRFGALIVFATAIVLFVTYRVLGGLTGRRPSPPGVKVQ